MARKYRPRTVALTVLAVGAILVGLLGFWQRYQVTDSPSRTISPEVVTHSVDTPNETQPICDDSYVMPADKPRKIEIPSLGAVGCIQQVGIDQDGRIAVPTNVHVAGWFVGSTIPGEPGVSIVDGHVGGQYTETIFKRLNDLKSGDTFTVEFGDRSTRKFTVLSNDSYSTEEAAAEQFKQADGVDRQLNLITCDGTLDPQSKEYDRRSIVRAVYDQST